MHRLIILQTPLLYHTTIAMNPLIDALKNQLQKTISGGGQQPNINGNSPTQQLFVKQIFDILSQRTPATDGSIARTLSAEELELILIECMTTFNQLISDYVTWVNQKPGIRVAVSPLSPGDNISRIAEIIQALILRIIRARHPPVNPRLNHTGIPAPSDGYPLTDDEQKIVRHTMTPVIATVAGLEIAWHNRWANVRYLQQEIKTLEELVCQTTVL